MKLSDATYPEIEKLLAGDTPVVAILPVGATEAHGPHLPLATDVLISEGFARVACDKLNADARMNAILLPSIAYTPADYAGSFAGTVSISPELLEQLITEIASNLKRQGFACLALANSHFDPMNVAALRNAARKIPEAIGLPVAFADATRRALAAQLNEEFQSGDCHAGEFETSIVLAERPELVRKPLADALPAREVHLIETIQSLGASANFESAGMDQAYCGAPAKASRESGEKSIEILAHALFTSVENSLFSTGQ